MGVGAALKTVMLSLGLGLGLVPPGLVNITASKSYLTPPRWRGLGNGSTPVSHHITICLRRVDENVDPAKFRRLCSARLSLTWGLGCPVGVGWVGPGLGSALLVSWSVHWVSI